MRGCVLQQRQTLADTRAPYTRIDALGDDHIAQLVALYSKEFWCNNRTQPDVERMLKHTDVIVGLLDTKCALAGFCRVLTDFVYKATIYDLSVHPGHRGKGLGAVLMDAVLGNPRLRQVEHFDLNCLPAMFGFYRKWGFTEDTGELGLMRRDKRYAGSYARPR
ncbi:MAG: GNAT family N-acetyltransferase [Pseudomonadota bacterium]|nr:MAG: GNAT family N-acetyltransferase [Pseudomonadota bacterium]